MDSYTQQKIKRIGESMLVFGGIVFAIWIMASGGKDAQASALSANRQAELAQLAKAVVIYEIDNNQYPINPGFENYCQVDERYDAGKCLGELSRDGYFQSLPYSGDSNRPYLYIVEKNYRAVGMAVGAKPEKTVNDCSNDKQFIWCLKI